MLVIHFVVFVVHLRNYFVTLCYSASKMSFARYRTHDKRKGAPSLEEFAVLEGKW